ncbi:nucleotidyl transferase AbiEii/AbiGii toxin family protein [candidate division WWE3 bacterium]|uniref:Nucleotidyl transferase AbiEii/AbiGii toxin family protein n=1 Tax=candidate division WWE3 bacterium TaxID=2053526 RepID=A0A7X9E6U9_UNCKA|nr:nucleotidyl transferase AbiEii/AbiGii toxin family protein [candidate division WWE3 bacterium]
MHKEVLNEEQIKLLPLLQTFSSEFGLVGGTAIALQIGHRRSIDYDLFIDKSFDHDKVRNKIRQSYQIQNTLVENTEELTIVVNNVKLTFLTYPFEIDYSETFENIIKLPNLSTLSAMKAFALGKRAKWKDYVDLFFVFKENKFSDITTRAKEIFGQEFNEKLFREQLSYYQDIDYSETIDYLENKYVSDEEIKGFLSDISIQE